MLHLQKRENQTAFVTISSTLWSTGNKEKEHGAEQRIDPENYLQRKKKRFHFHLKTLNNEDDLAAAWENVTPSSKEINNALILSRAHDSFCRHLKILLMQLTGKARMKWTKFEDHHAIKVSIEIDKL